jgi:hypothetical protein
VSGANHTNRRLKKDEYNMVFEDGSRRIVNRNYTWKQFAEAIEFEQHPNEFFWYKNPAKTGGEVVLSDQDGYDKYLLYVKGKKTVGVAWYDMDCEPEE